jgi:hypothetical protein
MVASMARPRSLVVALGALAVLLGLGAGAILALALSWPDEAEPAPFNPEAGRHVQSVIAQLLLREAGLTSRQDPLTLTAADVNAFLAGHVEVRDPPVWPVRVQIEPDGMALGGATTLGRLLEAGLGPTPGRLLPLSIAGRPVWVAARGQVTVAPGGRAEFLTHTATIGQLRVPVAVLWRALGGYPKALTWRMPRVVERIDIEPGRLLIRTRRGSRGASG